MAPLLLGTIDDKKALWGRSSSFLYIVSLGGCGGSSFVIGCVTLQFKRDQIGHHMP